MKIKTEFEIFGGNTKDEIIVMTDDRVDSITKDLDPFILTKPSHDCRVRGTVCVLIFDTSKSFWNDG